MNLEGNTIPAKFKKLLTPEQLKAVEDLPNSEGFEKFIQPENPYHFFGSIPIVLFSHCVKGTVTLALPKTGEILYL